MKKLFWGMVLLTMMFSFPPPMMAQGSVNIGFSLPLPPVIRFRKPPTLVVLPNTYVYVVPDVDVDIFFSDGWWWRPYEGRWYRSRDYNSGWHHYKHTPSFYHNIPRHWRNDYRNHHWKGQQWNPERRPHKEVQRHWKNWEKTRHWEKSNNWGIRKVPHNRDRGRQFQQEDRGRNDRYDRYNKHGKHDRN